MTQYFRAGFEGLYREPPSSHALPNDGGGLPFPAFRGKVKKGEKQLKTTYFTPFPGHLIRWAPTLQHSPGALHKSLASQKVKPARISAGSAEMVADMKAL